MNAIVVIAVGALPYWLLANWVSLLIILVCGLTTAFLLRIELRRSSMVASDPRNPAKEQSSNVGPIDPKIEPVILSPRQPIPPAPVQRSLPKAAGQPAEITLPPNRNPPQIPHVVIGTDLPDELPITRTILSHVQILNALEDFERNVKVPELRGLLIPGGWSNFANRARARQVGHICTDSSVILKVIDQANRTSALKIYYCIPPNADLKKPYDIAAEKLVTHPTLDRHLVVARFLPNAMDVRGASDQSTTVPAVLMEWVEGSSLHEFVENHRRDHAGTALIEFAKELRHMFEAFHKAKLIYGDYCDKNLIVHCEGATFRPRLVDYDTLSSSLEASDLLLKTGGNSGFVHPARLHNPSVILEDIAHTDAVSELVIYLSILSYCLLPELPTARSERFGLAPFIAAQKHIPELDKLRKQNIPQLVELADHLDDLLDSKIYPGKQRFLETFGEISLSKLEATIRRRIRDRGNGIYKDRSFSQKSKRNEQNTL